jgi:hypothetical protein
MLAVRDPLVVGKPEMTVMREFEDKRVCCRGPHDKHVVRELNKPRPKSELLVWAFTFKPKFGTEFVHLTDQLVFILNHLRQTLLQKLV